MPETEITDSKGSRAL